MTTGNEKSLRYLVCYSDYPFAVSIADQREAWLARARDRGIDAHGFCLTLDPPSMAIPFPQIDKAWKRGDPKLMRMYEALARKLEDFDVLVNYNGIHLHPEFVEQLSCFKTYCFFDDPEWSEQHSKPTAASYDFCLVGNVAELETYKTWGARDVMWMPLGFRSEDFDPSLTEEQILTGEREVDVTLLCERVMGFRADRLDKYANAFPQGRFHGPGWSTGFLPEAERVPLLQNTKVGINLHNSTGPINSRFFYLPANGVMQICDCKSNLHHAFELGKEIVGYETIEQAIELTQYYLKHDDERRQIAAAGFRRAMRDYNEAALFKRWTDAIAQRYERVTKQREKTDMIKVLELQKQKTSSQRFWYRLTYPARFVMYHVTNTRKRLRGDS